MNAEAIGEMIKARRKTIAQITEEVRELKRQLAAEEAKERKRKWLIAGRQFTGIWLRLYEDGMKERHVRILQHWEKPPAEVAEILGLSVGRIHQLRADISRFSKFSPSWKSRFDRLEITEVFAKLISP